MPEDTLVRRSSLCVCVCVCVWQWQEVPGMGCRAALLPLWVAFDQVLAGSSLCRILGGEGGQRPESCRGTCSFSQVQMLEKMTFKRNSLFHRMPLMTW